MIATGTRVTWEPNEAWGESPLVNSGTVMFGLRGADGVSYGVRVGAATHISVHESRLTQVGNDSDTGSD